MAAVWPTSLPCPTRFVLRPAGQRAASQPPGYVQQRNRTRSGWATADLSWVMTQAQLDVFEAFVRDDLHRGAAWLLMRLPTTPNSGDPEAPCYSAVRLPRGYSLPQLHRQGLWTVSAAVEIRDRFECAQAAPANMVVGFLTWARGLDGEGDVISEVGPYMRDYSGASYSGTGGQIFGLLDATAPGSYFATEQVGPIATGLLADSGGNERAWRFEAWGVFPEYAAIGMTSSGLTEIATISVGNPSQSAWVQVHRTVAGFGTGQIGSTKPPADQVIHVAAEKLPGQLPRLWSSDGSLSGQTFGFTNAWTDAYTGGALGFRCGGGVVHQARFAVWLDAADPGLFAVGGYNPENPLTAS